jgi:hypothetical protein
MFFILEAIKVSFQEGLKTVPRGHIKQNDEFCFENVDLKYDGDFSLCVLREKVGFMLQGHREERNRLQCTRCEDRRYFRTRNGIQINGTKRFWASGENVEKYEVLRVGGGEC